MIWEGWQSKSVKQEEQKNNKEGSKEPKLAQGDKDLCHILMYFPLASSGPHQWSPLASPGSVSAHSSQD